LVAEAAQAEVKGWAAAGSAGVERLVGLAAGSEAEAAAMATAAAVAAASAKRAEEVVDSEWKVEVEGCLAVFLVERSAAALRVAVRVAAARAVARAVARAKGG
jgi:hypothetical protein